MSATSGLVVGFLTGEGVGPQLTEAAMRVLRTSADLHGRQLTVLEGPGVERDGVSPAVTRFLGDVFGRGGAVLAGPVGGRFVYDLRRDFDLFCKLVPVRPWEALVGMSPFRREHLEDIDLVIVRENAAGIYQGNGRREGEGLDSRVSHTFGYARHEVERIVGVAARIAAGANGRLAVVIKDGGMPELSALWREGAAEACEPVGVNPLFLDVDLCAYKLVRDPAALDVIVAPNLFGDVLADVSALLLGARGASFSGNFAPSGAAVYQTNHGAAFDLADSDLANPVGHISALAMLLRESADEPAAAQQILAAVDYVWR
ncbi:MAG: isocitrate/isopropylmalate family dehydrogenase, partial [Solirubrobacterales bacterium]